MHRYLPVCLSVVLLLAVGCSSSNTGKIEGTRWISKAGTVGKEKIREGQITIDFGSKGDVKASVFEYVVVGKYTLGSGDRVTLEFEDDFLGEKSHRVRIAVDGETMKMSDASDTLEFIRRKSAAADKKES